MSADWSPDWSTCGDAALVIGIRTGEHDAFAALYDRYADAVHDRALRATASPEAAVEATHDTFCEAALRIFDLRDAAAVAAWLFAIVDARTRARFGETRRRAVDMSSVDLGDGIVVSELAPAPEWLRERVLCDAEDSATDPGTTAGDRGVRVFERDVASGTRRVLVGVASALAFAAFVIVVARSGDGPSFVEASRSGAAAVTAPPEPAARSGTVPGSTTGTTSPGATTPPGEEGDLTTSTVRRATTTIAGWIPPPGLVPFGFPVPAPTTAAPSPTTRRPGSPGTTAPPAPVTTSPPPTTAAPPPPTTTVPPPPPTTAEPTTTTTEAPADEST